MPTITITLHTPIEETPRTLQVAGIFDLDAHEHAQQSHQTITLPIAPGDPGHRPWNVGLITGPSGCGKSTLARVAFADALWPHHLAAWPEHASIVDAFPPTMSVLDITLLLSSVGFSSPPAWLRPYRTLSTGQQFRTELARLLAHAITQPGRPVICDEFTSVVDRTVAKIGSCALAKTVRQHRLQFVAISCHDDIIDWLQPDWIYSPADDTFTWRALRRRPGIPLQLVRCQASAWQLFHAHHYLSADLNPSAVCFLATHEGRPCAFSAWLPFVGKGPPTRREHRTVVLPDYQGVGIGMKVSSTIAALWKALGYRATSTTTHPAFTRARQRSDDWVMTRAPGLVEGPADPRMKHATRRLTAGFLYTGPALPAYLAHRLLGDR
jgi:GNAT superfamily N-acetyltransferase